MNVVQVEGDDCEADEEQIREKMILNPNEYKAQEEETEEVEDELNEMRVRAGLDVKTTYVEDEYIKNLKAMAGM